MQQKNYSRLIFWGLFASCLVYITAWFVRLSEGDASRLAATAVDFIRDPDISQLSQQKIEGPLTIWISGISMAVLGDNHIAYRIPGFLITLLCLFSVHRLTRIYFSKEIASLATLITATLPSTFLLNEDVSSDTYATAFYAFMIWQLATYLRAKRLQNFISSLAGFTLLLLSKGTLDNTSSRFALFDQLVTLTWAFAPWTLFLVLGISATIRELLKENLRKLTAFQLLPILAVFVPFVLFSANPFQSSHDAFLVYPIGSMFAANSLATIFYTDKFTERAARVIYLLQITFCYLILAFLFWIVWYPFPDNNYFGLIHYLGTLSIVTWLVFFSRYQNKLLICCTVLAIGTGLVMNTYYHPNLAQYQAGSKLGKVAKSDGVTPNHLYSYQAGAPYSLEFYAGVKVHETSDFKKLVNQKNCWVFTHQQLLEEFRAARPDLKILGNSSDFPFSGLNTVFLDPKTRGKIVSQKILIKL